MSNPVGGISSTRRQTIKPGNENGTWTKNLSCFLPESLQKGGAVETIDFLSGWEDAPLEDST